MTSVMIACGTLQHHQLQSVRGSWLENCLQSWILLSFISNFLANNFSNNWKPPERQSWILSWFKLVLPMIKIHLRMVVSWPGNINPSSTMSSTTSLTWFRQFLPLLSTLYFLSCMFPLHPTPCSPENPLGCGHDIPVPPCTAHRCLFSLCFFFFFRLPVLPCTSHWSSFQMSAVLG